MHEREKERQRDRERPFSVCQVCEKDRAREGVGVCVCGLVFVPARVCLQSGHSVIGTGGCLTQSG